MNETITTCPTCGSECRVEGKLTHYYVPVYSKQELEKKIAEFFDYIKSEAPTYRLRDMTTHLAVQSFIKQL